MSNRISIIVLSSARERLQMAAMVAALGAVSGNQVEVFVSMNALDFFRKDTQAEPVAEGRMGQLLVTANVPSYSDLFKQAVELGGAKIHPCAMAVDVMGLNEASLEPYMAESMGLTAFLDVASEGQVWSF